MTKITELPPPQSLKQFMLEFNNPLLQVDYATVTDEGKLIMFQFNKTLGIYTNCGVITDEETLRAVKDMCDETLRFIENRKHVPLDQQ